MFQCVFKLTAKYSCSCINYCILRWIFKTSCLQMKDCGVLVDFKLNIITPALYKHYRK